MDRLDHLFEPDADSAELDQAIDDLNAVIKANAEGDGSLYIFGYFLAALFGVGGVVGYLLGG